MAEEEEVRVCSVSGLRRVKRMTVTIHGRKIGLFWANERVFALDSMCYHAGGPLDKGQVKDIEDTPCVVCPWHKYIISLSTGEGMYQAIDPHDLDKPPKWTSKGIKQRTHHVIEKEDGLYVKLSDTSDPRPSDHYYTEEMANTLPK